MRDKALEVMARALCCFDGCEYRSLAGKCCANEHLDKAERALTALQAEGMTVVPGWQPIESAPKDGTRVILSWGGKAILGYYLDNSHTKWPWKGWKVPSMETWPPGGPDAWQPMPLPCAADDGKAEPKDEMGAEGEARSEHTQEKDA